MTDDATILGLLADGDRRRVFAALVLGARTAPAIADASGLDVRSVVRALHRLAGAGLVEELPGGEWRVDDERFEEAASGVARRRDEADAAAGDDVGAGLAAESARVLRNFVRDGRLVQIPAQRGKRLVVLDFLAGLFEPGRVYPERDVNFMLGKWHADTAALRRYLVDEEFLERRDGFYWRAGGTVEV